MGACCLLGLGGCAADVSFDALDDEAPYAARNASSGARSSAASLRCDGAPMPACEGPFTGSSCDLLCITAPGDPPEACGVDSHCHSDGSVYSISARNALLYTGSPDDSPETIASDFERFIAAHPADLALEAGLTPEDLLLHPLAPFRSTAGALTLFRFAQTYDDFPVLAPDGVVTLVYGPRGAVAMSGAIVDRREPYAHRLHQAPKEQAELSMLHHASARFGVPLADLEVAHAARVAMPMARTIAWAGLVGRRGGPPLARVIVAADPLISGLLLPLLSLRTLASADLASTQPIQVRTLDPAGEPQHLTYATETTLTTGAPLLGSVDDASGEIQLANEKVVVLDLHGALIGDIDTAATRILDPTGDFLADAGVRLSAQVGYHLFQGWYDFIDGHMTDPEAGAKRWDSANAIYGHGTWPSDTPAGTFTPRVLVLANASGDQCPVQGVACTGIAGYRSSSTAAMVLPEVAHLPPGASREEITGYVALPGDGVEPVTFAHELGHVVDLFTGGGITIDFAPDCGGSCMLECVEDTTDEAPPLSESIAQLLALAFLHHSFEAVGFEYCPIVDLVAVNGTKAWTPGPCIPPGEDISLFQRVDVCEKAAPYCDRPEEPGIDPDCCFDDEDLTGCTISLPDVCSVGTVGPSGGLGTGTARATPTGLCATTPGYKTNSLYQAFWQLLNGQRCDPSPPFACQSVQWAPDVAPLDASIAALLYALRVNALTYDQLFDEMARYVSCNYGAAAYEAFNAVACGHGIRDCAAAAPMSCEDCGNGVREGGESCDGTDWRMSRCEDSPEYAGGTLTCDKATCTLDESQCTMPGLDTSAGAEPTDDSPASTSSATDDETESAGETSADDGCQCRSTSSRRGHGPLALLWLLVLGARRRRRNTMTSVDRWIPASLAMLLLGCPCESPEALVTDAASSDSSSTGEIIDPPLDASRWIGRYHYEDAWLEFGERGDPLGEPMLANFEVRADGTATMFYEGCADWPAIVINYRWELGEDGWLHLYPGEGESRLRFMAADDVGTLRAYLGPPCRERMVFEADGRLQAWLDFYPGESCWFDRCSYGDLLRVDYCEGEEPPPCP